MRKLIFSFAFAVVVMMSAGQAVAAFVTTDLNMRAGPGTGYARIAVVPAGHPVRILNCVPSWCRIDYRGIVGWAHAAYLSGGGGHYRPLPPPPPPPVYYPPRVYPPYYRYPRPWWRPGPWRPY